MSRVLEEGMNRTISALDLGRNVPIRKPRKRRSWEHIQEETISDRGSHRPIDFELGNIVHLHCLTKQKSISSLQGSIFEKAERQIQRDKMMAYLMKDNETRETHVDEVAELSTEEQEARILSLADKYHSERVFRFNRFEHLCILDLLHCQHELILLDENVRYKTQERDTKDLNEQVHRGIQNYVEAIAAFQKLSTLRQLSFEASNTTGREMALLLHEPRYWESPDALNVFDLASLPRNSSIDGLRLWLQKHLPIRLLDAVGKERREIDRAARIFEQSFTDAKDGDAIATKEHRDSQRDINHTAKSRFTAWFATLISHFSWKEVSNTEVHELDDIGTKETKRIIDFHRQHQIHISPLIDGLARLLVSLIGVLLVLVPTIVLSYLTSLRWILVSTFMFTLAFSVAMSLTSKASNEQMIMATAAYGAVLVMFVANSVNNRFKE